MTRVVYVLDPQYEGGAERYLLRLAGGLDRNSFEPVWVLPGRTALDDLARKAASSAIEVHRHGPAGLIGALRKARPDLVHLNMPSTYDLASGGAAAIARSAGARGIVATEHIVDIAPSRRRALLKRAAMRWIDRFIAISRAHREIMKGRHDVPDERIRVIYNGVEDPGSPAARAGSPVRIVCVGALEHRKGQDVLIEALRRLLDAGAEARVVLVGDGPDGAKLEGLVRSLHLEEPVTFAGRVESSWPELLAADIVAVPSRKEGIPFAVLEGMAAGAAVVVSSLPGIDEVVEADRTGLVVPPGDPRELAVALKRLVGVGTFREAIGRAARGEYEKRFTLARMVRETEEVYREISG